MSDPSTPGVPAQPGEGDTAPTSAADDLKRERDAFIQHFFRKGAQFTDELLRENERLRRDSAELETENDNLRSALASNEAIRDLIKKIELLEQEKSHLLSKSARMRQLTDEFDSRYTEVETELANLASLHVATSQLHAARTVRRVLRNLKELLAQLLGAGSFAVYLTTDDRSLLVAVAHDGHLPEALRRVGVEESSIGAMFLRGEIVFERGVDPSRGTPERPAVVVPLHLEIPSDPGTEPPSIRQPLGAIVIFSTLEQKAEFWAADVELFKLLGSHAAPAIVHALLFEQSRTRLLGLAPGGSAVGGSAVGGAAAGGGAGAESLSGQLLTAAGGEL